MMLQNKVMIALDYETPEDAYHLVDQLGHHIEWYKLGPTIFTQHGTELLRFLRRRGKKIFVDLKLHDTPSVVSQTLKQFVNLGVQFATVHCLGGRSMLEAAAASCRGSQLKLLGVTLLTSYRATDSKDLGWQDSAPEIVSRLVDLAVQTRLSGILCSPNELKTVRSIVPPGFVLVTPGIRLPDQEIYQDDQYRIASPKEALEWGSDFLVLGRPFMQTRAPISVLELLQNHLAT